jgi:hypothetical protein
MFLPEARFEIFTAVKIQFEVFWVVTPFHRSMLPPSSLHPEDGGSKFIRNVGILLKFYTASELRRLRHKYFYLLFCMSVELGLSHEREEHRLRVYENKPLDIRRKK